MNKTYRAKTIPATVIANGSSDYIDLGFLDNSGFGVGYMNLTGPGVSLEFRYNPEGETTGTDGTTTVWPEHNAFILPPVTLFDLCANNTVFGTNVKATPADPLTPTQKVWLKVTNNTGSSVTFSGIIGVSGGYG
jgi:hypothetical protein